MSDETLQPIQQVQDEPTTADAPPSPSPSLEASNFAKGFAGQSK